METKISPAQEALLEKGTNSSLAELVLSLYKDTLLKVNDDIYLYNEKLQRWEILGKRIGAYFSKVLKPYAEAYLETVPGENKFKRTKAEQLVTTISNGLPSKFDDFIINDIPVKEKRFNLKYPNLVPTGDGRVYDTITDKTSVRKASHEFTYCSDCAFIDEQDRDPIKMKKAMDYLHSLTTEKQGEKEIKKPNLTKYLCQAIGYWLTGSIADKSIFQLVGSGDNGKTLFTNVLFRLFGTGAYGSTNEKVVLHKPAYMKASAAPELMKLATLRGIFYSEQVAEETINCDILKKISGGDPIEARNLYSKNVEDLILPGKVIILSNNYLPVHNPNDKAMINRIRVIPFLNKFEVGNGFDVDLLSNKDEILDYIFTICLTEYHKCITLNKSMSIPVCEEAKEEAKIQNTFNDMLSPFLENEIFEQKQITVKDVWAKFNEYCDNNSMRATKNIKQQVRVMISRRGYKPADIKDEDRKTIAVWRRN